MNHSTLRFGVPRSCVAPLRVLALLAAALVCAGESYAQAKIPGSVIESAAARAGRVLGRTVKVFSGGGQSTPERGTRVMQLPASQFPEIPKKIPPPAFIKPNPSATATEYIVIAYDWIRAEIPQCQLGDGPLEEVVALILIHEFQHMPECGNPVLHTGDSSVQPPVPPNCRELKQREQDSRYACERIRAINSDSAMSEQEKFNRVGAICTFMNVMRKQVDTPEYLAAAANCTTPPDDVDLSDGQIFDGCCPECCTTASPTCQPSNI